MKLKALTILIALAGCLCAGAETLHDYVFSVGDFDRLSVLDNVNVVYRCVPDSAGYAAYRGERDFADSFIFSNKKGDLHIQVTTEDVGKAGLPTIYVYSDFLLSASNSSDFTLRIESPTPVSQFKCSQIGNGSVIVEGLRATRAEGMLNTGMGKVTISGTCKTAVYKMVGTGSINADRLKAEQVQCTIFGSGSIGCWPLQQLKVKGLGSTKIYYKGSPTIKKSGGGKLIPLPGAPDEKRFGFPTEDETAVETEENTAEEIAESE